MRAASAGTGKPAWARIDDQRVLAQECRFAGHVRPGQQHHRRSGERSQSFGTKAAAPPDIAASTTGCRPASTRKSRILDDRGAAPACRPPPAAPPTARHRAPPAHRRRRRWRPPAPAPFRHSSANTRRSRAAARFGRLAMRRSSSVSSGAREARAVGHALAQDEFREAAQPLDGGRGRLDDVAELGVVADLQAGDAVALRVVQLQAGDDLAAVVAQSAARRPVRRRSPGR